MKDTIAMVLIDFYFQHVVQSGRAKDEQMAQFASMVKWYDETFPDVKDSSRDALPDVLAALEQLGWKKP